MRKLHRGLLLLPIFLLSANLSAAPPSSPIAGNPAQGRKLFTADGCYECHGRQGQGGFAGPRLAPPRIPFGALKAYVRHPSGAMPPYTSKVISDSQLDDIYAFLKTLPAPLSSIPLLNP